VGPVELFFYYLLAASSPLGVAATNISLAALTLFFLWRVVRGRFRPSPAAWVLAAFLLWQLVSALFSPFRAVALRGILDSWAWVAFFVAASLPVSARREAFPKWAGFLALSAALTVPVSLAAFFFGTDFRRSLLVSKAAAGTVNAHGFFSHHLTYAGVMATVVLVTGALALYGRGRRWPWWVGSAAAGVGLVASLARTYWVGLLPSAIILLWRKGWKIIAGAALAGALAGGALLTAGPEGLRRRVESLWDMSNASNVERLYLWRSGLDMWKARPVAGWGPNVYERAAGPFKAPYAGNIHYPDHEGFRSRSHCHNLYIMTAVQTGAVGLLLLLAFIVLAFREIGRQQVTSLRVGATAALAAFLVGGIFEFNGGDAEVATLLFFLVGLALGREEPAPGVQGKDP